MNYSDFSSWPRDQEQQFVVFEQRAAESQKKAVMFAVIAAIGTLVIMLGIYAGVTPDQKDLSKGMNMSNLSKKSDKADKAEAPAPAPDKAAAPAPAPAAPPADKPADSSADKK